MRYVPGSVSARSRDAAVVVRDALAGDRPVGAQQLDADAGRGRAALGVEDVGRDRRHAAQSLAAWTRCSRAISSSRALTSAPPRTTSRAADDQPVDAMRPADDQVADEILGAAELEPVRAPDGEVGALARRERADVVAAQHLGAAARREAQRVARGQRRRAAAAARDEQRVLHVDEEVAALVRGAAVDAEPDAHAGVEQSPAPARRPRRAAGSTSGSARRRRPRARTSARRRRRGGRSARTTRRRRASRRARGTRPACSRRARGSTRPPRPSRRGACAAAARASARAPPTPPSAAS